MNNTGNKDREDLSRSDNDLNWTTSKLEKMPIEHRRTWIVALNPGTSSSLLLVG